MPYDQSKYASELAMQKALSILEEKKSTVCAAIAVLQSRLNFVRCLAQEITSEERQKMAQLNDTPRIWGHTGTSKLALRM